MKKRIRYGIFLIIIALVAYNSVYFKKLDEVKAGISTFNAKQYASDFWTKDLPPAIAESVDADSLLQMLQTDKDKAFQAHAHALGIGNVKYFLIRGNAKVTAVEENEVQIQLENATQNTGMRIATEYVFGNAVRDATGTIDINAFANSMDFNNVSAEINKIIREKLLPDFRSKVKKADRIEFAGAVELNQEHLKLNNMEVIPVSLKIVNR